MERERELRANKLHKVAISAAGAASQHSELMLLCSSDDAGRRQDQEPHPSDAGGADRDGERERQHPAVPRRRRVRSLA